MAEVRGNGRTGERLASRQAPQRPGSPPGRPLVAIPVALASGHVGSIGYDGHGNTTAVAGETLRYDAADRHAETDAGTTAVAYRRDATDRIIERSVGGTLAEAYAFTGDGDTPDAVVSPAGNVVERDLTLPGGVVVTRRATGGDVWSYPNIHGDVAATCDGTGTKHGPTST